jgi:chemotaxis family two-component system sensor kinase Cph1
MTDEEQFEIFLDRAIHDLRASARQIGTSAEIVSENVQTGAAQDSEPSLRRLREGIASMGSILTGMTSYAVTLSAANYTFRRVNLTTALSSALARLRERISLAQATVVDSDLPQVKGDADRLSEVFQHLIGNALTYRSEAAPRIEVRAVRDEDLWRITVQDNGIGFEPKYSQQVFAPFYRLHGPELPGVGLGLAVCRRILNAHRGSIWIESEKGSGTTCVFTLPADDDE